MRPPVKQPTEKATDKIIDLGFYDNKGHHDYHQYVRYTAGIFFASLFTLSLLYLALKSYFIHEWDFFYSTYDLWLFADSSFTWWMSNTQALFNSDEVAYDYIIIGLVSLLITVLAALFIIKSQRFKSWVQSVLASNGLSQFYLDTYNKQNKEYVFRLIKGETASFDSFMKQQINFCQMMEYPSMKATRIGKNKIKVVFQEHMPTIEELRDFHIQDFLKEGQLFLGIGVPGIDENIPENELLNGKFIPRYLKMTDLPVGIASLGTAGMGKTVSADMYLASIFKSFHFFAEFHYVDFKGGIANNYFNDIEKSIQTGKIFIYDNSVTDLYKLMKRLDFTNKARMAYLKEKRLDKFEGEKIFLIFDELAEILDYKTKDRHIQKMIDEIAGYLESILRTGRSQGFIVYYSTQSYLSTSSGLTSGMKNNSAMKIMHGLGSRMQVGSVKPVDDLDALGIDPTKYDVGRNVVINEMSNTVYEARSLYMPPDVKESLYADLLVKSKGHTDAHVDLSSWYLQTFYLQKEFQAEIDRRKSARQLEDEAEDIYSYEDILRDLGVEMPSECLLEEEPDTLDERKEEFKKTRLSADLDNLKIRMKERKQAPEPQADELDDVVKIFADLETE